MRLRWQVTRVLLLVLMCTAQAWAGATLDRVKRSGTELDHSGPVLGVVRREVGTWRIPA